jgi:hypothetical protein
VRVNHQARGRAGQGEGGGICTKRGKYRDMEKEEVGVMCPSVLAVRTSGVASFLFFFLSAARARSYVSFAPCICMYFDTHELGRQGLRERISTDRVTEPTWLTCQPP